MLMTSVSNDLLVKMGTFAPSITALFLTYLKYGKEGVKNLLKRALQYRFNKVWYLYIFLLMPGILTLSFLFMNAFTGAKFNSLLLPIMIQQPWLIVPIFLYMLILQGPLGEEFGWRGFALDH
ncbi:hypothetical protein RDV78_02190 [Bacillota bacterium LX-D]|nr:hypothetical protein [Bacillota bacterium LX-D]